MLHGAASSVPEYKVEAASLCRRPGEHVVRDMIAYDPHAATAAIAIWIQWQEERVAFEAQCPGGGSVIGRSVSQGVAQRLHDGAVVAQQGAAAQELEAARLRH